MQSRLALRFSPLPPVARPRRQFSDHRQRHRRRRHKNDDFYPDRERARRGLDSGNADDHAQRRKLYKFGLRDNGNSDFRGIDLLHHRRLQPDTVIETLYRSDAL